MNITFRLGYNTNGLADLDAVQAIDLLHSIGYEGIAITLDHRVLNPFEDSIRGQVERVSAALEQHNMHCVIETGARFLLNPQIKHEPTLLSPDPAGRERRIEFLRRAIEVAAALNADCVSLWSGAIRDGAGDRDAMDRLASGLAVVLDYADRQGVTLAFEPEPDMFIATLRQYGELLDGLGRRRIDASRLRLTLDIGHAHCQSELPIADQIHHFRYRLVNVHIEDMRAGVHEHLMFGEGEIDFPSVIAALAEIRYAGPVNVELSRHSHEGPAAARRAYDFLRPLCDAVASGG